MRIAILGIGRLGASVALLLARAGADVLRWRRGDPLPERADAWWVTVPDGQVRSVAETLPADAVVLHAAGAHGPELLGERRERGVLHPLMTFPGPRVGLPDLRGVGARIDGTERAVRVATDLALLLGMRPFRLPGDPAAYHAAACLVSGHLGALFLEAAQVLARAGVPAADAPGLLLPLAQASLERAATAGPAALTGPAARGDENTERRHLDVLTSDEARIYLQLSYTIRKLRGAL